MDIEENSHSVSPLTNTEKANFQDVVITDIQIPFKTMATDLRQDSIRILELMSDTYKVSDILNRRGV